MTFDHSILSVVIGGKVVVWPSVVMGSGMNVVKVGSVEGGKITMQGIEVHVITGEVVSHISLAVITVPLTEDDVDIDADADANVDAEEVSTLLDKDAVLDIVSFLWLLLEVVVVMRVVANENAAVDEVLFCPLEVVVLLRVSSDD